MSKARRRVETYRSESGRYLDMPLLIRDARRHPGVWFLAFPAAPKATATAIQGSRHLDLRAMTDGHLEAEFRNEHLHEGRRRGDVYVRFVPTKERDE